MRDKQAAAQVLASNIGFIVNEWTKRVKNQIAEANKLPESVISNYVPAFIEKMIVALNSNETNKRELALKESSEVCIKHGKERATFNFFSLDSLIQEYRIMRIVLLELLDEEGQLTKNERKIVLEMIDSGITHAASSFSKIRVGLEFDEANKETKRLESIIKEVSDQLLELQRERKFREQFVLTLTHDLRTPLTAAMASCDLILTKTKGGDLEHSLCRILSVRILNDLERIDKMVKNILDANRIRAGQKLPLSFENLDLSKLLINVVSYFKSLHGDRFEVKTRGDLFGLWSEEGIKRLLDNLLSNAIKHGSNTDSVKIYADRIENFVRILIHNKGTPIPKNEIEHLFDKDFQPNYNLSTKKKGWGLGLTIVKGIVEAHKGTVSAVSDTEGTTFIVDIPVLPD